MKLISLNTWGGRAGKENLLSFFKKYKDSVDIFCLQEIWSAPYTHLEGVVAGGKEIDHSEIMVHGLQQISELLSEFTPYFRPHHGDHYGLLIFVRKTIQVKDEGEIFVYKHKGYKPEGDIGNHARNIQFINLVENGNSLTVINFHGLWNGKGKGDSEDRIVQSRNIGNFIMTVKNNIIFCGDFNLSPQTESIKLIENLGLRNLIVENNIQSTRTSFYKKPDKFADYMFVSPNIKIKDFRVLLDEISDHAPLLLESE